MRPVCKSCNYTSQWNRTIPGKRLQPISKTGRRICPPGVSRWCRSPPCSISPAFPGVACYAFSSSLFVLFKHAQTGHQGMNETLSITSIQDTQDTTTFSCLGFLLFGNILIPARPVLYTVHTHWHALGRHPDPAAAPPSGSGQTSFPIEVYTLTLSPHALTNFGDNRTDNGRRGAGECQFPEEMEFSQPE